MGKKANPGLIGAFVVGAVVLAVVGVAVFGSGRFFHKTTTWVMYFDGSVNGLRAGAPVKFKGVEIGSVTDVMLNVSRRPRRPQDVRVPVIVTIDLDRIQKKGGHGVMDEEAVKTMVEQGLRAQLRPESFVTGVLYIELDLFPETPARFVKESDVAYAEIPTLPTALEQVQVKASQLVAKLADVDIEGLVAAAKHALEGVDELVRSPGVQSAMTSLDPTLHKLQGAAGSIDKLAAQLQGKVDPASASLKATAEQAQAALKSLRDLVEPGSPITRQLGQALAQVEDAARAVRALAEYLERNPSAVVRGKATSKDER
ncbi:MAG: MlaD family protein [Candidatus Binatia bacterium]